MNISIICSDNKHPIFPMLQEWIRNLPSEHNAELYQNSNDLKGGDLLFLISCSQIIGEKERSLFKSCIVLHASDLPKGRGWSPHIWEVLGGAEVLTISAIDAAEPVDSGDVWRKLKINIPRNLIWNEVNQLIFNAELKLMTYIVENYHQIIPMPQPLDGGGTYYRKRTQEDSEINPRDTIENQFDLLRICDPNRFPAFVKIRGRKYKILVKDYESKDNN